MALCPGMGGKVAMRHQSHGVAQVQLANMYVAVPVQHVVHTQGPLVAGGDAVGEPPLKPLAHGGGVAHAARYLVVGQQEVGTVHTVFGLEEGVALEAQPAILHIVFEGEIAYHPAAWLGDDTLLRGDGFEYPLPVVGATHVPSRTKGL